MSNILDALIIGNGPAGISAAVYLKRAGKNVTVIGKHSGSLLKSKLIENYYGFYGSGVELFESGIKLATSLGIEIRTEEATDITPGDGVFTTTTDKNEYISTNIVFAVGVEKKSVKIPGLADLEGKGVSRCAVCDGFFFREKRVCVLGNGEFALHEARYLSNICKEVVILTNGQEYDTFDLSNISNIKTEIKKIARVLEKDDMFNGVEFVDGATDEFSGMFIALGTAGSDAFARKLGLYAENGIITVDKNMQTDIPGFYAAGDCTGAPFQVAKAVYQGMTAAYHIINKE